MHDVCRRGPCLDTASLFMTDVYDALMDALAALAVAAVHDPETAVQSYWLALLAQPDRAASPLTLGNVLQAHPATVLPLPSWAQPLALRALQRLLHDGVWLATPALLPQADTAMARPRHTQPGAMRGPLCVLQTR